jgi:outer membrane cobalamin receptor
LISTALAACARPTAEGDWSRGRSTAEQVVTEEQILASGAHTAWEVLQRHGRSLTASNRRDGSAGGVQRRGRSSIYLNDSPIVFLDGVRLPDIRSLQLVPAHDILSIRILSGIDATTYYGTNAGSGVILVQTKSD